MYSFGVIFYIYLQKATFCCKDNFIRFFSYTRITVIYTRNKKFILYIICKSHEVKSGIVKNHQGGV